MGFVADTAHSSSEAQVGDRLRSVNCKAQVRYKEGMVTTAIDPEKTVSVITAEIQPRGGGNQRDSVQKEQVPDHEHRCSRTPTRSCSS